MKIHAHVESFMQADNGWTDLHRQTWRIHRSKYAIFYCKCTKTSK